MNANEIITVFFTDNLTRHTSVIDMALPEYIAVLDEVTTLPAVVQDDAIGLGIYTIAANEPDAESGCCDCCGAENVPIWREDSAGWECAVCLVVDAVENAHEEQAFRSAEQNAASDPNWPENDPYQLLP